MAHWEDRDRPYLAITNVIYLEAGTIVECLNFPDRFLDTKNPYSKRMILQQVTVGEVYRKVDQSDIMRKHMANSIEQSFKALNLSLDKGIMQRFINHQIPQAEFQEETFVVPPGLYIVADIVPLRRGQENVLHTYKPGPDRPKLILRFRSGVYHPTNINQVTIVRNPGEFGKSSE
ncbi:hypothetical protein [Dyadobacter sp. Leaf189]|uniref:hypothetical protein n=1 Tax=Dyadobacter sp. Leaf189 TaxID=1736295 RepID=UPI0006F857F0|nr:hypothetical protein [Dyadobacter sp. Leaf189]KQS33986.1 hypothetical protein ASG33_08115 [Dyadobacter sp. Leaf189]